MLIALCLGQAALGTAGSAHAARYEIDSARTTTRYETRYLGFVPVRGEFGRMTGMLQYAPEKPPGEREASIHVVIDATTLKPTTFDNESKRRMLRGPEFFNVEKFPTIEFKSTRFRYEGDKLIAIDGAITLVGVTKPVTLTVLSSGCTPAASARPARCVAETELTVKRFDFGMNGWSGTVSDEVKISVDLIAVVAPERTPEPPAASPIAPASSQPAQPAQPTHPNQPATPAAHPPAPPTSPASAPK